MDYKFEWTKDLSVGESIIDSQHQKLLEQVNGMIQVITEKTNIFNIIDIIKQLDGYIKDHFSYEEKYMSDLNYPGLEDHKIKHTDFIERYNTIKNKLSSENDKEKILLELEQYVGNWLIIHVGDEDHKYFLFSKGEIY